MRDLVRYPITTEEVMQTLRNTSELLDDEHRVGDLRPYILRLTEDFVGEHYGKMAEFLQDRVIRGDHKRRV